MDTIKRANRVAKIRMIPAQNIIERGTIVDYSDVGGGDIVDAITRANRVAKIRKR